MEKIINYENLRYFTYSNDKLCSGEINGIVISFFGLGNTSMFWEDTEEGIMFAKENIILLVPYNNPWAWMNRQSIDYTDEIVDVIINKYSLPDNIPIVSSGGSMGGLASLVYTRYAKRTPVACVSNCPVCDLPYHYTERPDLPRTLYSALANEEGTIADALEKYSPLHLADTMPDINYYIFHCTADKAVNKERHSDVFVEAMKKSHKLTYNIVPDRGHCDLTPEMWELYNKYRISAITEGK